MRRSVSRHVRGGARSARLSSYCIGWWPCTQSTGSDWDGDNVADRSGNGAHATLGQLTKAEIGDNAGSLTTLNSSGHCAYIPAAKWTHRFATHSLIIAMMANVTKEGSTEAMFGNRDANSGFALTVTTAGKLQWVLGTSSGSVFGSSTTPTPYENAEWHHIVSAYDVATGLSYIYVDGAQGVPNTASPARSAFLASDGSASDIAIGGRGQNATIAGQFRHVSAYSIPAGLPANMADLVKRLYYHPMLPLTVQELGA